MAYLPNQDDDELNKDNPQQQAADGPVQLSSSGGVISGFQSQGDLTPTPSQKSSGSGFTNLKNYISSNTEQAGNLSSQIAGNITQSGQKARDSINQTSNVFNQASNQGSTKMAPTEILNSLNDANNLNDDQIKNLNNQYNATYKGPSNLSDVQGYSNIIDYVNKANQNVENTKSEAGRQELIKPLQTSKASSEGVTNLNNLLLQNSASGRQTIENAANSVGDLSSKLATAERNAQNLANLNKNQTDYSTQFLKDQVGTRATGDQAATGQFKNLMDSLNQRVNSTISENGYNKALADVTDDIINQQLLEQLGLKDGQNIYNLNLQDYIYKNPQNPTIQNLATAEDVAKYNALLKIAGLEGEGDKTLTEPGTYNSYVAGMGALQNALNDKAQTYNSVLKDSQPIKDALNTYMANGGVNISHFGIDPSKIGTNYNDALEQLNNFETYYKRTNPEGFKVLNGGKPPDSWNWDSGNIKRNKETFKFYYLLKDYVNKLKNVQPNRTVSKE